jgi:ABC-2 type transport system ATP-binding protein
MDVICIDNISKSFGSLKAVNEVTLNVPQGSIYGFLGPNGAGKTTTIRMIMNIIRPDSGRIEIFGRPLDAEIKNRISYMPEERGLYKKMTASEILFYIGSLKGLSAAQLKNRIPQWLQRLGLSEKAKKKTEELSRGLHQKLQFAVCAINEPDVLILDEPFAGLDPVNLELLTNIIMEMRSAGRTIIFSTHVMHEAERLCDDIVLINKGRIVVDGRLDDIKSKHSTGTISVQLDGDIEFIKALPYVTALNKNFNKYDIVLKDGSDPQQLLSQLVGKVKLRSFEIKSPSLHEIFIRLVGADNETDS